MRIIATSDTHYPVKDISIIPDGDVFIHAGDLMQNGYPDEWNPCLTWLAALPHKHKYYIPGNHDFHVKNYPGPALQDLRKIGVTVVGIPDNPNYRKVILPNGMVMAGLPFVLDLPKWAFNISWQELDDNLKKIGPSDIVVSHCPLKGILDTNTQGEHVGICGGYHQYIYHQYIRQYKPHTWIHGHVHESYGIAAFEGCKIYNVAMCDRHYKHANPPMIIDV